VNFYAAQDSAKKKTRYLVLLYIAVLLVLTFLSTLVLMVLTPFVTGKQLPNEFWLDIFSPQSLPTFLGVGAFVIGGALISSYVKSRQLAKGGGVIAASLGGVKLQTNTNNLNERKVLNVVQEMAVASGMPVPEVYVLKKENAINAFAAGQTTSDAVIGVTQGCIDKLSRRQLQGVIGHEFSHVLNGDMRLNLRIIMLLHGIEFIGLLGRILTTSQRRSRSSFSSRSRSKSKGNGALVLAGIALRVLGWFGIMFGNIIQAAVSRQREFLADASSVQFTRDPSAIAGALKVIGGVSESSRLKNTDVNEVAHLFFGQSFTTRLAFLFATHPPIEMRIRLLEPSWNGEYLKPIEPVIQAQDEPEKKQNFADALPQPLMMLMAAGVMIEQLTQGQQKQLSKLVDKSQEPMEGMALIVAILLCEESMGEQAIPKWKNAVQSADIPGLVDLVENQINVLKNVELSSLLPLVELTMPALKNLSEPQYIKFKGLLESVMMLDGQQSVFEQSLFKLVTRHLDVHFGFAEAIKVRYRKPKQVAVEIQVVLSLVAHFGSTLANSNNSKSMMDLAFQKATHHLNLEHLQRMDIDASTHDLFTTATEKLLHGNDALKQQIVEALVLCVEHDGEVNSTEKELVLAIAATMDAPIPRLQN